MNRFPLHVCMFDLQLVMGTQDLEQQERTGAYMTVDEWNFAIAAYVF